MHDEVRSSRRRPINDPDRWEAVNDIVDEHNRRKANQKILYSRLKWYSIVVTILGPIVIFFHDAIVHVSDAVFRVFRGGN
jgi:hypothetical protein